MAHACAGRVFCIRVFPKGFGRPHQRARVREARPLFSLSLISTKSNKVDGSGIR